jgi:hypothetical protein
MSSSPPRGASIKRSSAHVRFGSLADIFRPARCKSASVDSGTSRKAHCAEGGITVGAAQFFGRISTNNKRSGIFDLFSAVCARFPVSKKSRPGGRLAQASTLEEVGDGRVGQPPSVRFGQKQTYQAAIVISARDPKRTSRLLRTSMTLAGMFICRRCVRYEIGVLIAPAAIACQHSLPALFNRTILAVPVHALCAVLYHGAPRGFGGGGRLHTKHQRGEYRASGERSGHNRPPWSVSVITPNGMAAFQSSPR